MTRTSTIESGRAAAIVDLDNGARLCSLRVDGHELLVTSGPSSIEWGCYPMAPWAGRTRRGRFSFADVEYELPTNLGGHAIHGTVFDTPWEADGDTGFRASLGAHWPFPGFVRQQFDIGEDGLQLRLEVHSLEGPMPAACGWHPWFRRTVAGTDVDLHFQPEYMLERDNDGIAGRQQVPVPPGPWDDCFGNVARPVRLTWPGVLALDIDTSCDFFVVYDRPEHAVCIEPQTAPPDTLNHDPVVVTPSHPLVATTTWRWSAERGEA